MKSLIIVALLVGCATSAFAQYSTYDPPPLPGMSGTLRGSDGSFKGFYTPPMSPGIDSGRFIMPGGGGYIVDEPADAGGQWRMRRDH